MIKYGLLVGVLGAYVCVASASACTLQYDPVCGSDGKTYSNNCFLALKMSKNLQLQLKYKGACEKHDRQIRSVICSTEIKNVCGSDGITYSNPCFLNYASNDTNKIKLLHYGACNNKSIEMIINQTHEEIKLNFTNVGKSEHIQSLLKNKTQAKPEIMNVNITKDPVQKNPSVETKNGTEIVPNENPAIELSCPCGLELEELCGNDGVTYDNPCLLKCAAKLNNTLEVHFEGRCNGSELIVVERKRRSVQITNNVKFDYTVNGKKPNIDITINGKKYVADDDHMFGRELNPEVARRFKRDTKEAKETKNVIHNDAAELLCACGRNLWELCGTDGVTYNNECLFECAQKINSSLRIQFEGRCDDKDMFGRDIKPHHGEATKANSTESLKDANGLKHDSPRHEKDVASNVQKKNANLLCACPKNLRRVCGTNGQTYLNHCLLKCAGKGDKNIGLKHEGPCDGIHEKSDFSEDPFINDDKQFAEVEKPNLYCVCPKSYHRVCGTDGVTYDNSCYLKCAARYDGSIQVRHEGPCDRKRRKITRRHANLVTFRY